MVGTNCFRVLSSIGLVLLVLVAPSIPARAADSLEPAAITAAIRAAIPLLEKGSAGSAEQRVCFTCHNQALPILALSEAKRRGFDIDEENLTRQIAHTKAHLQRGRENYLKGKGQGGGVITAGYALWALEASDSRSDETTAAVAGFLLQTQSDSDHWRHPGNRPPSSGSDFTTTYIALRGLDTFGTEQHRPEIEARVQTVREWLLKSEPKDTEDQVFQLRSLKYAEADDQAVEQAANGLIATQREDGGWAQTPEMESDAYATGTAVVALLQVGGLAADHPAIEKGLQFLLRGQLEDGSWHVATRAKPFQTYFESGFPHEKDQFISIAASSWATLALLLALPEDAPASN
jgi:N-acyl-D-amino-acid deacylase